MAKVLSPLLSGKARGQISKSLVFFPWKSINAVRSYVIPANPDTAGQQAQRTKMTNAVDKWHDTAWIADDKTAWNLFATVFATAMSGFNAFIKTMIDYVIAGGTWKKFYGITFTSTGGATADVDVITDDVGVKCKCLHGESKTFMPTETEATAVGANQTCALTGLTDGVTYFLWVKSGTAYGGRTGIYKFKHVAP